VADEAGEVIVENEELDPEASAKRRMALAQIRQYPDSALRLPARELAEVDADVRRLAGRMIDLMHDALGTLRRVIVFRNGDDPVAIAVVNPTLAERSEETSVDDEGCLSLQGVLVPVERSVRVTLVGLDLDGQELRLELDGLAARVVQHEVDHLDGVLIIDRTDPESRKQAMATLRPQPILVAR
jgi:peptide deformylase